MLPTHTSCLIVNFLLAVQLAVPSRSKIVHLKEKLSIIDAFVSHAHKHLNIPEIAVGIVADGKTVFQKGYGIHDSKDIHGGRSPVTPRTLFGIGSCSKPFTTYALDRLVNEDGALAWNDLVLSHVPEFRLSSVFTMDRIQVRDLVTHVSGLPSHEFVLPSNQTLPRPHLFSLIAELCTNYELREKFQYNNLVFWVASVVLERVILEEWRDAIYSLVFKPLNMTLTFPSIHQAVQYREDRINIENAKVVQIVRQQKVSKNGSVKRTSWAHVKNMAPSGSIYSCVEDMVKWIHAQLALPESAKAMHDPQVVVPRGSFVDDLDGGETFAYGLGWMLARHRGQRLVWCGGPFDEFTSRLILCPEKNLGVVILTSPDERPFGRIVHNLVLQIFDTLTTDDSHNMETPDPVEWAKQQANTFLNVSAATTEFQLNCSDCVEEKKWVVDELEEYAGVFQHGAYGTVVVRVDKAQLIATRNWQNFVLKPGAAADFFRAHSDDGFTFPCSFKRDSVGDVAQFFIKLEPTCEPIPFGKIPNEDFFANQYIEPLCGVYKNGGSSVQIKTTKTKNSAGSTRESLLADGSSKYTGILTPRSLSWFRLNDDVLFKFVNDLDSSQVLELHVYDEDYEEAIIFKKTSI